MAPLEGNLEKPFRLRCEYTHNPIGLDVEVPRLSWTLTDSLRGTRQSAYQVQISKERDALIGDMGDVWDSGKVVSRESVNIQYRGVPLETRQSYSWRIRWWDDEGRTSPYSDIAAFETGFLDEGEWSAHWIEGKDLFRKRIIVDKEIKSARAHVSGLGFYELYVNGSKIGDQVLDPGWTSYDKIVMYTTHDVTDHLTVGENVIAFILGNGRYAQQYRDELPPYMKSFIELYDSKNKVGILQLHLTFADGSEETHITDGEWTTEKGPLVEDDLVNGEVYDARLEHEGWNTPGYDDSQWAHASLAEPPRGRLASLAAFPPIAPVGTIKPVKITSSRPGVHVYDFGQNFAGWVRLRLRAPRGTEVKLRHAELLNPDGTLNVRPNRSARAEDTYIAKGGGLEEYEPRFTYHGFRYVEVTGFPGAPNLDTLEGVVVNSDIETTGGFSCSNPLLNDIHRNVVWGQLSNLIAIPTDCPQRDERLGWLGDAQLTVEEILYNFDAGAFLTKWIRDIRLAQRDDGSMPNFAPPNKTCYPSDPAWGIACIVVPWHLYLHLGDSRILEENYVTMRSWLDYLETQSEGHILRFSRFGDWCPPGQVKPLDTSGELVSTWCQYHGTLLLSKIEKILGKDSESLRTAEHADRIMEAFNGEFLGETSYDQGSQTSNLLPLWLDMPPDDTREKVLDHLIEDIVVTHDGHLSTGIIGTRYLLDTLTKHGRTDLAYQIATKTTYPSWGYMIREGATTLWERWEYLASEGMNSHNHIMFGSVDAWFYRVLAGINVDEDAPGYERVIFKPYPVDDLDHASASVETMRGTVSSSWKKNGKKLLCEVTIPTNSSGILHLPIPAESDPVIREGGETVWENGSYKHGLRGIDSAERTEDRIVFNLGSGVYSFEVDDSSNT